MFLENRATKTLWGPHKNSMKLTLFFLYMISDTVWGQCLQSCLFTYRQRSRINEPVDRIAFRVGDAASRPGTAGVTTWALGGT